jgi:hypothetical protein
MPKAQEIVSVIERNLAGMQSYGQWTVGLATKPDITEADLDYPAFWRFWATDSIADAREVRAHLLKKGMKDGGERGQRPLNVFLY